MELIKKNYKNIMMYIGLFLILFYPFNISFKDYIYKNEIINLLEQIIGLMFILIPNYKDVWDNIKRNKKIIIPITILVLVFIFIRNGDIINRHFGMPFYLFEFFMIILIFSSIKNWHKIFSKVFMLFIIEHIIGTWFCFIFKDFYFNNILPIFKDFANELLFQYNQGQIAGFTQHYSTNATYLLQGLIFELFFIKWDFSKIKKQIPYYILVIMNFGALLLTGKRAQLFFGLIAIFITIIIKNKGNNLNVIKKYYKQIIISIIGVCIIICSVPVFSGAIKRTYESFVNKDTFESRKPMNDLAIRKFKDSILLGNGWGTYKYFYHDEVVNKERNYMDAHNIYLQLLCEVGVIGFSIFILLIIGLIVLAIKNYDSKVKNRELICIFIAYQIYILLEGIVGNSIYDIPIQIPMGFFIAMFISAINKKEGDNNE